MQNWENGYTCAEQPLQDKSAKQKGLRIFHLPPYLCFAKPKYSPHLNLIETLWRKMKYNWLKPGDYSSWEALKKAIDDILNSVGKDLKIKFKELKYFTEYKANKTALF
jgi:transposase